MAIPDSIVYPRSDRENRVSQKRRHRPGIVVGDYTFYNDFVNDPAQFQKNNVLYRYPVNPTG
jgi:virginiamycin A acetyltransferase